MTTIRTLRAMSESRTSNDRSMSTTLAVSISPPRRGDTRRDREREKRRLSVCLGIRISVRHGSAVVLYPNVYYEGMRGRQILGLESNTRLRVPRRARNFSYNADGIFGEGRIGWDARRMHARLNRRRRLKFGSLEPMRVRLSL